MTQPPTHSPGLRLHRGLAWVLAGGLLWLGCAGPGSAQVQRCTHPVTGQITYTDGPCPADQAGVELLPALTPEQRAAQEAQYQAARERWQAEQARTDALRQAQAEKEAAEAAAQAARQPPAPIILQVPAPEQADAPTTIIHTLPWGYPSRPHHGPRPPAARPPRPEPPGPPGPGWHCNVFRCTDSQGRVVPRP